MARETEEARDSRLRLFVKAIKDAKCRELIDPLAEKIKSYMDGKIEPEDVFKTAHYAAREGDKITGDFKKRPEVILAGISMDANRYVTEIGDMNIKVRNGDLTMVFADSIVVPASPDGVMSEGPAGEVKIAGGIEIEKEAVSKAPLSVGEAVSTGAGSLYNLHVIHAPVTEEPEGKSSAGNVKLAVSAALALAEKLESETLAVTGMGTRSGGVACRDAALAVVEGIKEHSTGNITDIILLDREEEMVEAFVAALEMYDDENE